MCGICGFFSSHRAIVPEYLEMAAGSLTHRGPDGLRTWVHPRGIAGLGHARLAIIDLECGQQPMSSVDGRFIIVFNGEIYNYRELRSELLELGHVFRTRSDTEVLLNAYRQWSEGSLIRLSGMFAFAIFDTEEQKLFLARDRTGIKPLYYHWGAHGLVFGSEIKALLAWPHVPRQVDFQAVADFLMLGYPLLPATCFRDCRELEPGSFLEVTEKGQRAGRYWSWSRTKEVRNGSSPVKSLEWELRAAVREHLVSDVPVGAFLSGGIDSSLLVALVAADGGPKIQTFNVKFGEAGYDESVYARAVAAHVGTEHHELAVEKSGGDLSTVEQILDQFDQPFGDSSAIPTYLICREIRKHVKVVIGGDGGDEMFGGYPRFLHADTIRLLGHAPGWFLRAIEGALRNMSMFPTDARRQALRLLRAAQETGQQRLLNLCSILRSEELLQAIQPEFANALGAYRPSFPAVRGPRSPGGEELIDVTIRTALPGDYLRKVDVMSSAHGLEVRVPMLANRILEFAAKLPQLHKYSYRANKILLRRLAKKFLPAKVVTKRKQGFGIPLDSWLGVAGRAVVSAALSEKSARLRDLIRPTYIQELMTPFASQNWDHTKLSRYSLYQRFYALWSLERWLSRWHPTL
jgi:asparagine synthase (glutamine-hydrolysing)